MPSAPKQAEPPAGSEAKPVVSAVVPPAPPERALPGAQASSGPVAPKVEASPAREPAERPPVQVQAVQETNEKAQSPAQAKPEPVSADPSRETSVVKAGAGDTIFSIILRHYGRYNWALEQKVLEANPRIKDRDRIFSGQRITMPDIKDRFQVSGFSVEKTDGRPPRLDEKEKTRGKSVSRRGAENAEMGTGDKGRVTSDKKKQLVTC